MRPKADAARALTSPAVSSRPPDPPDAAGARRPVAPAHDSRRSRGLALSGRVSDAICGVTVTLGCAPERMTGRQAVRSRKTSSVACARSGPASSAASKRVVVDQRTAAGIDDHRALRHPRHAGRRSAGFRWRPSAAAAEPGSPTLPPEPASSPERSCWQLTSGRRISFWRACSIPERRKFSRGQRDSAAADPSAPRPRMPTVRSRASGGGDRRPAMSRPGPADACPSPDGGASHGR
jgi:hypothetical protein